MKKREKIEDLEQRLDKTRKSLANSQRNLELAERDLFDCSDRIKYLMEEVSFLEKKRPIGAELHSDDEHAANPCQSCGRLGKQVADLLAARVADYVKYITCCERIPVLERAINDLKGDLAERDALFEMRRMADGRAIARWRALDHAARSLTMPDQTDLCVFLMERISELETYVKWYEDKLGPAPKPEANDVAPPPAGGMK